MGKMRKIIIILIILNLPAILSGCAGDSDRSSEQAADNLTAKLSKISSDSATENVLRFGIVPSSNASDLQKTYGPITKYLQEQTGCKIELKFAKNYETIAENLGKDYDFAQMGAYSYIQANSLNKSQAIVKSIRKGQPFYHSIIFVNTVFNIKNYSDFKGKEVVFTDRYSTAGFLYPAAEMIKNGIDISKDIKYKFVKGHDNAVLNVASKSAAAGAAYEGALEKFLPANKKNNVVLFKIVDDPIPSDPVVAGERIIKDVALKEKLSAAFINLKDKKILEALGGGLEGYSAAGDNDYNVLREKIKLIEKYVKP